MKATGATRPAISDRQATDDERATDDQRPADNGRRTRPATTGRRGRRDRGLRVRVGLLTREYPPDVYGGAGVHVEFLARELRPLVDLEVHCWGEASSADKADGVVRHRPWSALDGANDALRTFSVDLAMT